MKINLDFLQKIQSKPSHIRKLVFWAILVVLALVMIFWWFRTAQERLSNFNGESFIKDFQVPRVEIPEIEIPEIEVSPILQDNGQTTATTTE